MLANEKTSKPLPLGLNGLNFSKRITTKYAIFRKSGRLPNLIYLRLCGIRVTKKIKVMKKINIISLKSTHSIFKLYFNLYLKLLLSSCNLNKTGLLQGAKQWGNLSLKLLYFLHNNRESSIIPVASPKNIIAPPTSPGSIITKGKAPYHINLTQKFFTFLRSPLGDMELIDNLNNIRQASHYKSKLSLYTQMDRLEISSDQDQGFTPMINPREVSLQLQTKRSREISQISDKPFSDIKIQQLPVEIISVGGLIPLSSMRKQGFQSRPVNTQNIWRFSHSNADLQGDMPQNRVRFFTPPRSAGETTMRLFSLLQSPGETIMNLKVTREGNEDARSGFSDKNAFTKMTSSPQKFNDQALISDSNIIPEIVYTGLDNNIYNNSIQKTNHMWQEMLLSSTKEPVSNNSITQTNLILKKVIRQDANILSKNKKGIEKITLTKINHITHNLANLIHKKPITQNTDTAPENQKTLLETEKTISRKIINEDFITDTIKERPIQGINMIADKVYKIIEKRITIEKDRRGGLF